MIKSILGGKSKNLFDISKADVVINANVFNPTPGKWECFYKMSVTPGQTYTVSCDTTAKDGAGEQLQLSCQTGDEWNKGTQLFIFLTWGEMIKDWVHIKAKFTIPDNATQITFSALDTKSFRNFQIELGSTATEYVPHELTSYKSIMKVSDVCQLIAPKYIHTIVDRGVTFTNNGDGSITVNGTPTGEYYSVGTIGLNIESIKPNHKYVVYDVNKDPIISELIIANYQGGYIYKGIGNIFTFPEHPYTRFVFEIRVNLNQTANNIVVRPQIFDLTEMFGAGNEPKTVAEFKAKFPNDYYPYSPSCFVTSFDERMPCKTKNLFDIPLIEGYPSDKNFGAGTLRTFTIGTYVVGMTRRNNYYPSNVINFNVSKNSISLKNQSSGYGINVPLILTVGQTYTISCIADNNFYPGIGISYYKEDGTFIIFTEVETITNNPIKSFTVPENTYYTVINFYGRSGHSYMFSNIQLEKGTTATDYVPHNYV